MNEHKRKIVKKQILVAIDVEGPPREINKKILIWLTAQAANGYIPIGLGKTTFNVSHLVNDKNK